ncbi:leucine-rich repeat and calponin homology domain-containing protein 1-like isoform X3 [Ptychodera flava]|uniref:leucine-rich repeat and calponin homology domain-containing protein 1-like isoform X3 n=1 Tax=Ptychodera flava TaxID=63121 RepID=UPI00396A1A03
MMAVQTQSPQPGTQLSRSMERVLEDAQVTGYINLSGRKLKDYPQISKKYDLADCTEIDLSKNRLSEVPREVCECIWLEKINCYSNVIKSLPEDISKLKTLVYLNLSRNQLTNLPIYICLLQQLQVLVVSNNKLVSLPEEIGKLEELMDLDVSCNEINALPNQVSDLKKLRCLNVRKNHLVTLPEELYKIRLVRLDVSCNKITVIPPSYRQITSLEAMILDNNPLVTPPPQVCRRGRGHIFKYLSQQAAKDDKKRGVFEQQDMKVRYRRSLQSRAAWFTAKTSPTHPNTNIATTLSPSMPQLALRHATSPTKEKLPPDLQEGQFVLPSRHSIVLKPATLSAQFTKGLMSPSTPPSGNGPEEYGFHNPPPGELRRHIVSDSGYFTANGDKRWSASEPTNEEDEARILAERASQQKELRHEREKELRRQISERAKREAHQNHISYIDNGEGLLGERDFESPSATDEFARGIFEELEKQTTGWKAQDEKLRLQEEEEREKQERRRAAKILQQNQERILQEQMALRERNRRPLTSSNSFNENTRKGPGLDSNRKSRAGLSSSYSFRETSSTPVANIVRPKTLIYNTYQSNRNKSTRNNQSGSGQSSPQHNSEVANHQNEDKRITRDNHISESRHQAQVARRHMEEAKMKTKQMQKAAVINFVKQNRNSSSSLRGEDSDGRLSPDSDHSNSTTPTNSYNSTDMPALLKPRSAFTIGNKQPLDEINPNFTLRREMERVREEMDQLEQLRRIIESRLKVTLPDDLPAALTDGVVLCHLANNIRPHAITSIHVPSPAVPKLTLAKCRRNVENFIEACRKIGVPPEKVCSAADIIDEKSPLKLGITVQALVGKTHKQTSAV